MRIYVPAWHGDHRLESTDDGGRLVVTNSSVSEAAALTAFMAQARKRRWTTDAGESVVVSPGENLTVPLRGTFAKMASALMKSLRPGRAVLTAVRYADGKVETVEAMEPRAIAKVEEKVERATASGAGAAAAEVARPRLCCPRCYARPEERLAAEVLEAFLDARQLADWRARKGFLVVGGTTGHVYDLAHRHSPEAMRRGFVTFDCDDAGVLHAYDWRVPPPEELLGVKLMLEHREEWVRNEASCLGRFTDVPKNPWGTFSDGITEPGETWEAAGVLVGAVLGAAL